MVHDDKYETRLFRKVHPDLSKSSFFKLLVKFADLSENCCGRGAKVAETVGTMTAVGWAWQQQGGYDLVGHVPRYTMVRFGRHLTQCKGAGGDTVENRKL